MKGVLTSVIVLLAVVYAAGSPQAQAPSEPYRAGVDSDGVQRVTIVGGDYFFKPAHIIVKVNVPVELSVRKEPGFVPHNLVLNAPAAGFAIEQDLSQEIKKITFTPAQAGLCVHEIDPGSLAQRFLTSRRYDSATHPFAR